MRIGLRTGVALMAAAAVLSMSGGAVAWPSKATAAELPRETAAPPIPTGPMAVIIINPTNAIFSSVENGRGPNGEVLVTEVTVYDPPETKDLSRPAAMAVWHVAYDCKARRLSLLIVAHYDAEGGLVRTVPMPPSAALNYPDTYEPARLMCGDKPITGEVVTGGREALLARGRALVAEKNRI